MEQQANVQTQKVSVNPLAQKSQILKRFPKGDKNTRFLIVGSLLVVLLGVGSGWLLSGGTLGKERVAQTADGVKQSENEAGFADESQFPDSVEGTLLEEGFEGEGTHHLERTGGPSQNVYLTSTVIDLQSFVGKKVKVWGETLSAVHAGWLMDVGKIKVIE